MLREVNILFIPGIVVVVKLCIHGAFNLLLIPRGVSLALMMGVSRGVKVVGGATAGG
jgi:hypothetical protein